MINQIHQDYINYKDIVKEHGYILNKQIKIRGIIRPIHQQIYDPVLEKLDRFDINFKESN